MARPVCMALRTCAAGVSVRRLSSTVNVRSPVCDCEARWRTSRHEMTSTSAPPSSSTGSACRSPSDSSNSASARLAPRDTVRSAEQCGSTACASVAPNRCGAPWRKSGDAVTKASTCGTRRVWHVGRWGRDGATQALARKGRRKCLLRQQQVKKRRRGSSVAQRQAFQLVLLQHQAAVVHAVVHGRHHKARRF